MSQTGAAESLEELKKRIEALRNLFNDLKPLDENENPKESPQISAKMSDEVVDSNPYRYVRVDN